MIDKGTAESIFDVLASICGAPETHRIPFIAYLASNKDGEYRFQGKLGFGGKFYFNRRSFRVGYYPEDFTPDRQALTIAANRGLQFIFNGPWSNL